MSQLTHQELVLETREINYKAQCAVEVEFQQAYCYVRKLVKVEVG